MYHKPSKPGSSNWYVLEYFSEHPIPFLVKSEELVLRVIVVFSFYLSVVKVMLAINAPCNVYFWTCIRPPESKSSNLKAYSLKLHMRLSCFFLLYNTEDKGNSRKFFVVVFFYGKIHIVVYTAMPIIIPMGSILVHVASYGN